MNKWAAMSILVASSVLAFLVGKNLGQQSLSLPLEQGAAVSDERSMQCPKAPLAAPLTRGVSQPILPKESPQVLPSACSEAYAGMTPLELLSLPTDFEQTAALYTITQQADLATLKGYIENAMDIAVEGERSAALSILFMRYSDLNPQAALDDYYALGLQGNSNILYPMFSSWAKADMDTAIARVDALPNPEDQRTAKRAIMRANASAEPQQLERIAQQLGESVASISPQALAARARTEPEAAVRSAMGLTNREARANALQWIANVWAKRDSAAALAFSQSMPKGQERTAFRFVIFNVVAQQEPDRAIALVAGESHSVKQSVMSQAISAMVISNPARALAVAMDLPKSSLRTNALTGLFHTWAKNDPVAASIALEATTDISLQEGASMGMSLIPMLMQSDPDAGLAFAERWEKNRGNVNQSYSLWESAVTALVVSDPERAMQLATDLPTGERQVNLITQLIGTQARTDIDGAIAQLDQLPTGEARRSAVSTISQQWIQNDPVMAMEWVTSLLPEERHQAIGNMAWQLANTDIELALAYTDDLTPQERSQWIPSVSQLHAQINPDEALAWLEQYQNDSNYGHWVGQVATHFVASDPKKALKTLGRIEDPEQRDGARFQVVDAWARVDPVAVGKWWHRLDDDERNLNFLDSLVGSWTRQDQKAAKKWSLRLAESEQADRALLSFLSVAQMPAKDASKLIIEIDDPNSRLSAYQQRLWTLTSLGDFVADDWVDNARLPEDLKAILRQQLEQARTQY
ncbi:MAG: hypothetical protein AB8B96_13690 [Lysobacterales bacterium]